MADAKGRDRRGQVSVVRAFNRFYTRRIGVLNERLLASRFSLTEVRVLYELAHRDRPTAALVGKELALDAGYLSRILAGFRRRGLVGRARSTADARESLIVLTAKGRSTFAVLNRLAGKEVAAMLADVEATDRDRLASAMRTIQRVLEPAVAADRAAYRLRAPRAGDFGWVIHRHGVLYREEYGWDERFEALVAGIVAEFVQRRTARERCWIAERDGEIVGSVFVVKKSPAVAQLRLLYVEPSARGLGIGKRLVDECIRFARRARYRKMILWTQSTLTAARHIYERAGFRLVRAEQHESFGYPLTAEIWEMKL